MVALSPPNPYNLALFAKNLKHTNKRPLCSRRVHPESTWHSCKVKKF